jgi:putative Holliday junction resolvase|tara:strand:+ start:2652 stop:3062 length:411 start_codon:yes stop_codon:yes gene_type:complete
LSKLVAIDYGAKRTGIAETDSLQIIASGLTTVETKDLQEFMKAYLEKEDVEVLVVGQAKRMSGELSEIENKIVPFINFIKKRFPSLIIERQDEGFTSQIAFQTMIDGGLSKKKRRDKALVDKISATLILQRFMENR